MQTNSLPLPSKARISLQSGATPLLETAIVLEKILRDPLACAFSTVCASRAVFF